MRRFTTLGYMGYAPSYRSRKTRWVPFNEQSFPMFRTYAVPLYDAGGDSQLGGNTNAKVVGISNTGTNQSFDHSVERLDSVGKLNELVQGMDTSSDNFVATCLAFYNNQRRHHSVSEELGNELVAKLSNADRPTLAFSLLKQLDKMLVYGNTFLRLLDSLERGNAPAMDAHILNSLWQKAIELGFGQQLLLSFAHTALKLKDAQMADELREYALRNKASFDTRVLDMVDEVVPLDVPSSLDDAFSRILNAKSMSVNEAAKIISDTLIVMSKYAKGRSDLEKVSVEAASALVSLGGELSSDYDFAETFNLLEKALED